jgi:hypothetical protein
LGIDALHKAGYEQPPGAEYRFIYEGTLFCDAHQDEWNALEHIYIRFNDEVPGDYHGRSVSPSDVIELYDEQGRRYFYCNSNGFTEVKFSPILALPMKRQ